MDRQLNHSRSEIVLDDKEKNECKICDRKRNEKRTKNEDLRREVANYGVDHNADHHRSSWYTEQKFKRHILNKIK